MSDGRFLWMNRTVVVCFAVLVTGYAVFTDATIHKMVENAYKVTLVSAFVPLVSGLYWKRATTQGAALAIVGGLGTWIALELLGSEDLWPPQFVGFLVAVGGMIAGSHAPQWYGATNARAESA
jgi:Na+/proline symporter